MKKLLNTFLFCILIVILIGLFNVYKKINFNEFSKSEYIQEIAKLNILILIVIK